MSVDAQSEVLSVFRPEFFNRLDSVVRFQPLGSDTMKDIARLHLGHVAKRPGLLSRRLRLHFTDALISHVAQIGFDQRYGARPLQRAIEEVVVTPLAERLVREPELADRNMELDVLAGKLAIRC